MKSGCLIIITFGLLHLSLPALGEIKSKGFEKDGAAKGTSEMAAVTDKNFRTLSFSKPLEKYEDISKLCASGCYTLEEEAFADVKKWMVFGCPTD
ncbi:MAG: hypothetical protein HOO93_01235 [Methyloglobulus sp.]|nr:hypothetical protein [Methyloglobulus sp.]